MVERNSKLKVTKNKKLVMKGVKKYFKRIRTVDEWLR